MVQRYDIEKAMSSVSLIISGLHIYFLASCIYTSIFLVRGTSIFRMLYLCKKLCMKDVLKISILLIFALSNGALFAQTNGFLNSDKDTLDIKFVKDTLVTSTIQDTLLLHIQLKIQ